MNTWRNCYSENERRYNRVIAPKEFLKANGLNKFCALNSSVTSVVKDVLDKGKWNNGYAIKHHGEKDIPYLDHGYIYKNAFGGVLVYLPYIRYDKSLLDMTNEIRNWAANNSLYICIVRESWYHPDAFVVIVTSKEFMMRELVIKWDTPDFHGRMTNITRISEWNF